MKNQEILNKVEELYNAWKKGLLGGEKMPEDENPNLLKSSEENLLYFTLPMALNYQRNSYKLWESVKKTYMDIDTKFVFNLNEVIKKDIEKLKYALTKYKVALQPNKQTEIWLKLARTIARDFKGGLKNLFIKYNYDIAKIKEYVQITAKKDFPYLSGNKICNYWLYVLTQYTSLPLTNKQALTIAPDTHVIQASEKLGLISEKELNSPNVQIIVTNRWQDLLKNSKYAPIDMHTPLWLWSRNDFKIVGVEK